MFTTASWSGNSNRCGTRASRSFGPMSGSVLMRVNTLSITSRNSRLDSNSGTTATSYSGADALDDATSRRGPEGLGFAGVGRGTNILQVVQTSIIRQRRIVLTPRTAKEAGLERSAAVRL